MFQRFFAMIGAMLSKGFSAAAKGMDWALEAATKPPRMIVGGGGAGGRLAPEFDPSVSPLDLIKELHDEPETAVRHLDRDGIETVIAFAKASPTAKDTVDLSVLPKRLRAMLLTMCDQERAALASASLGAVRKFVDGRDHDIHGVPIVGPLPAGTEDTLALDTPDVALRKRIRAAIRNKGCEPFVMPKMLKV